MANFLLKVNNKNYPNWTSLSITRSVDQFCGSFNFVSTDSEAQNYPIKEGDNVQVLINEHTVLTGFVDEVDASFDTGSHSISVRGRDNVGNLIDSDIPNTWKNSLAQTSSVFQPVTISDYIKLCQVVIQATENNIPVLNVAGSIQPFTTDEVKEPDTGQKAIDFLSSFARKRNLYLNTDGQGSLRIYRPLNVRANDDLILLQGNDRRNNILSRNVKFSQQDRFRNIVVRSQEDSSSGSYDFGGSDPSGSAIDTGVNAGRHLEIMAEESMTSAECKKRAEEEVNIRRARSIEYSCTVADSVQSNGALWDYGLRVRLVDEIAGINGIYFIRSVNHSMSLTGGTVANLVLASADAYRVIAELTDQEKRKTNLGAKYIRLDRYTRGV